MQIIRIIIIVGLWISIFETYPCPYCSKANLMMNHLRLFRHVMLGFLRRRSGVQLREGYAVIHRPPRLKQFVDQFMKSDRAGVVLVENILRQIIRGIFELVAMKQRGD